MIRAARAGDVAFLPAIERAAGEAFRDLGMAAIADDEPLHIGALLTYQRAGRAWVATDDLDDPVAYLLLDVIDDAAHIEQVSVHPEHAGGGLGRELIDVAAAWAREHGLTALTLTTFADVPWNGPYYARLGFAVIAEDAVSSGLRRIRAREAALGLEAWPRIVMRRAAEVRSSTLG